MVERALFGAGSNDGCGIQTDEKEGIAVDDGQTVRHSCIDSETHAGGVELHAHRRRLYGDLLVGVADREGGIDADVSARLHQNVFLDEGFEPDQLDFYGVFSGLNEVEYVLPGWRCFRLGLNIGLIVLKRDVRTGDNCAGGVAHDSLQLAAGVLRDGNANKSNGPDAQLGKKCHSLDQQYLKRQWKSRKGRFMCPCWTGRRLVRAE